LQRKHNPELTFRARQLRSTMTRQERHLWYDYLSSHPVRFLRQKVIEGYIADFYCSAARLVVELDGGQHFGDEARKYDAIRTQCFARYGIEVIRIPNNEVELHFSGVCEHIDRMVQQRLNEKPSCQKGGETE